MGENSPMNPSNPSLRGTAVGTAPLGACARFVSIEIRLSPTGETAMLRCVTGRSQVEGQLWCLRWMGVDLDMDDCRFEDLIATYDLSVLK